MILMLLFRKERRILIGISWVSVVHDYTDELGILNSILWLISVHDNVVASI